MKITVAAAEMFDLIEEDVANSIPVFINGSAQFLQRNGVEALVEYCDSSLHDYFVTLTARTSPRATWHL